MFRTIPGPKLCSATRPISPNLNFTDPSLLSAVINFVASFSAEITDNPDGSASEESLGEAVGELEDEGSLEIPRMYFLT
ncbi:hypothetical protein ACFX2I_039790 [Malus domestica]